jgi:hypothetical protein
MPKPKQQPLTEALYAWGTHDLSVLIPKRRGFGYMKVPYGHHSISALNDIADTLHADINGLDGHLHIDRGHLPVRYDLRDQFAAKALPLLAGYYKFKTWREIGHTDFCTIALANLSGTVLTV